MILGMNFEIGDLFTVVPKPDSHMAKIGDRSYSTNIFRLLKIEILNPERILFIGEDLRRITTINSDVLKPYNEGTIGSTFSSTKFLAHEYNIYKYEGDAKFEEKIILDDNINLSGESEDLTGEKG